MRAISLLAVLVLLGGSIAFAQPATTPPQQPTTTVLIIPFKQIGNHAAQAWISQALENDLVLQAERAEQIPPKTQDKPLATVDSAAALAAGRKAGAEIVVFGSYQVFNNELRVTGQVDDVASGRVLRTLSVTKPLKDIFFIEDSLAAQFRLVLPPQPNNALAQAFYGTNQTLYPYEGANSYEGIYPYTATSPDLSTYVYPYTDNYEPYPYDNFDYESPYYDTGYPYGFGDVYIGGGYYGGYGRGFSHGFHHRGFAHGH